MDPIVIYLLVILSFLIGVLWTEAGHENGGAGFRSRLKTFYKYFFE